MSKDNLKSQLFEAIERIISVCGAEDWDGFGALPISRDSVSRIKNCLDNMFAQEGLVLNDNIKVGITPWPTGDLSIDFLRKTKGECTLVSITPNQDDMLYIAKGKDLAQHGRSRLDISSIYKLFRNYFGFKYSALAR